MIAFQIRFIRQIRGRSIYSPLFPVRGWGVRPFISLSMSSITFFRSRFSAESRSRRFNGLYFSDGEVYTCGTPIRATEPEYLPEWVGKSVGVFVFLFVYLYMIGQDIKSGYFRRNKKTVFLEGVPVYDLPQI